MKSHPKEEEVEHADQLVELCHPIVAIGNGIMSRGPKTTGNTVEETTTLLQCPILRFTGTTKDLRVLVCTKLETDTLHWQRRITRTM